MKTNAHQLWLCPLKKRFNPLQSSPPSLEARKGISFGVKGIKKKERRQNSELSLRQEPPPFKKFFYFLVQILFFSFLWPAFHRCLLLLLPKASKRLILNPPDKPEKGTWMGLCLCGALARLRVALGMENGVQSKVLRFHFLFPSPHCPSLPTTSTFACLD